MDFADYVFTMLENEATLAVVFLLLLVGYYVAFYRKLSFNVFDAFTVEMISSAGAALGVYVMFVYGNPQPKFLFSFITCELALFAAIFGVRHIANRYTAAGASVGSGVALTQGQKAYLQIFFYLVSIFYVVIQLISFKLVGLVLFSSDETITHVNAYDDYGVLLIIMFTMNPIFTVCMFIKRRIFGSFTLFDYGCIAIALFSMLTSGSKSSFVVFFTAYAIVDYKFSKLENKPKTTIPLLYLALFFGSILLILTIGNIAGFSDDSAINKLFQRIALSGDGFVIGYDDSAIRFVLDGPRKTALEYIFYPLYGKLAILAGTTLRPSIVGIDLYLYAFGIDTAGANGRHNLLSVIFWGPYWGWLLSFLIGGFIGFVRFYLYEKVGSRYIFYLIFVCVLTAIVPVCITDAYLFTSTLFYLLLLFVFFLAATVVVYEVGQVAKAVLLHYWLRKQTGGATAA